MIPVKILAVRYLANASPALAEALGAPTGYRCLGLLTTDSDDATMGPVIMHVLEAHHGKDA